MTEQTQRALLDLLAYMSGALDDYDHAVFRLRDNARDELMLAVRMLDAAYRDATNA